MSPLVWLVTGCSSGIGEQFVREALDRGDQVIATARGDLSRIHHLKDLGATVLALDVTASQAEVHATVKQAANVHGRIDVLINNAGFAEIGTVEESSDEFVLAQLDANFFGSLKATRAVLPYMRLQKSGFIAFISSIAAWEGMPCAGSYAASKAAIEGICESLKPEIAAYGVESIVFPLGQFRTSVFNPNNVKYYPGQISDYSELNTTIKNLMTTFDTAQPGDPAKAVKIMVDVVRREGVMAGKPVPARLPIGPDAVEIVRKKCRDTLAICDSWEQVSSSTNFT